MGVITLDFDLEKEAAGLPVATYQFQIMDAVEKESSNGNLMVALKLAVVNDPQYNGRIVFDNLVLVASMARRLKAFGDAAGVDLRMGVDTEELKGKVVWGDVIHDDFTGEPEPKIKRYRTGR